MEVKRTQDNQTFGVNVRPDNMGKLMVKFTIDLAKDGWDRSAEERLLSKKDAKNILNAADGSKYPDEERIKIWEDTEPLPAAKRAGEVVASRLDGPKSHITDSEDDLSMVRYLAHWSNISYLSLKSMGETEDHNIGYAHRRVRIVGMLRTIEEKYKEEHGAPKTESDWKEYYTKVYKFFDARLLDDKLSRSADWIKTYIVYYLAAWNYSEIDFVDIPENPTEMEKKFRGLCGMISELDSLEQKKLMNKFRLLDKHTGIYLSNERYVSGGIMKGMQNLESASRSKD